MTLPLRIMITTRHILPYDNTQTVTMCVPTCWLHLDMLSNHIETKIFCLLYIVQQGFIGRSCIQSVRPPSLVKQSKLKQRLIIQFQAYNTICITTGGVLTHSSIAIHLVYYPASTFQYHFQCIEEGGIWSPQPNVTGHKYFHPFCIDTFSGSYQLTTIIYIHLYNIRRTFQIQLSLNYQPITINIRSYTEIFNMFSGNWLHPYRLPNTAYGSIPDTFRITNLLSTGLRSFICRIPNFYEQQIITFSRKGSSNIKRKRSKSTCMATHFYTIHPHICFPINSTKVQQHLFSFPNGRNLKTALVN